MNRAATGDHPPTAAGSPAGETPSAMLRYERELAHQDEQLYFVLAHLRGQLTHATEALQQAQQRLREHEAKLPAAIGARRIGVLLKTVTLGWVRGRRLRRSHRHAEHRVSLARQDLRETQQRHTWIRAEHTRVGIWLDTHGAGRDGAIPTVSFAEETACRRDCH